MKFKSIVCAVIAAGLFATSFVGAEEAKEKKTDKKAAAAKKKEELAKILKTTTCPLSGRKVDAKKVVAYKDSKVYVCCGNCVKGFEAALKKKPEVAVKSNHQLVLTKQAVQKKCAMNGKGKINKETKTKLAGVTVNTCCKNCLGALTKKDEKEAISLVFGKNFKTAFVVKAEQRKKNKKAKEAKKDA